MDQEEKSERSRAQILEAALELFSRQGYRGTSIRDISRAASVSTGSVYHHFHDKEELFDTLLSQYWAAIESPDFPFNRALASGAFPDRLEELAEAAEVSQETIYKAFGGKAGLLKAVYDTSLAGDDEAAVGLVRVHAQPGARRPRAGRPAVGAAAPAWHRRQRRLLWFA